MAHTHDNTPENFNLAFAIAVGLNFSFVIIEIVYALTANSMSLLADAGHNFGDVFGLVLAWGASWLLTRKASERYSYGFKKTSVLAALINALILVATSALIAYESVLKLLSNAHEVNEHVVVVVALIGLVINGGTALLFMRGRHSDLNIRGAFLHLAYDALISIGVVTTGLVILWGGWEWLDPVVGLLIVVAILLGTWELLRDSVNLMLDAVPAHIDQAGVENYLRSLEHVKDVHDLHIWGLSTKEVAMTAHLVTSESRLKDTDYKLIHKELLKRFHIHHPTIQVESGDSTCQWA